MGRLLWAPDVGGARPTTTVLQTSGITLVPAIETSTVALGHNVTQTVVDNATPESTSPKTDTPLPLTSPSPLPAPTAASTPATQGLGWLNLQVPKDMSLSGDTEVYERETGTKVGSISGAGSYLLPSGDYYLALPAPFVGVTSQDIVVRAGAAITVNVTEGRGKLSLPLSPDIALEDVGFTDEVTGHGLGNYKGNGPFWLAAGVYTVKPGSPFVGVSHRGVVVESGGSVTLDVTQGLGRIFLLVPQDISLIGSFAVYDKIAQVWMGQMETAGRYWLLPGSYRINLPSPFVGLVWADVQVTLGNETTLSSAEGLGKLTVKLPEPADLVGIQMIDAKPGQGGWDARGSGPFWQRPGTYTVTLDGPAPGVSFGEIPISAGAETVIDMSSSAGTVVSQSGSLLYSTAPPGKVVPQLPTGVAPDYAYVHNAVTGLDQGSTSGKAPFWLAAGTYTVSLSAPFIGAERAVNVKTGDVITVDMTTGLGQLFLAAPEEVTIGTRMFVDQKTGQDVG